MSGNPFDKPFRFPMPEIIDPPKTVCMKIEVPDDPEHIANLLGALWQLCYGRAYSDARPGTVKQVIQVWRTAYNTITFEDCESNCPPPIAESDYEMSLCEQLRVQNGVLQALCCGKWEDIDGQATQGIGGGGQPGTSPQPTPEGGCQDYQGNMGGASPWYVPTVVSSGDTINIHDTDGIFYENGTTFWFCPDGGRFFVTCTNQNFFDGASQMPSVPLGRMVAKIGATYYDIFGSTFTVPGGIVNAPIQLEMNTAHPAGSGGNVAFTVTVCNNQSAAWTHVFDFRVDPWSEFFTIEPAEGTVLGPTGEWRPGVGYGSTAPFSSPPSVNRGINLTCLASFHLVSLLVPFTFTPGTYDGDTTDWTFICVTEPSATHYNAVNMPTTPASPQVITANEDVTSFVIQILCGHHNSNVDPGGDVVWPSLTISGTGVNPFA